MTQDFLFRGSVADLDPALQEIFDREEQRQRDTIILIPSESAAPLAVNEALGSTFSNIYAEGYPAEYSRKQTEEEILDFGMELATYRRMSDPRYYKGVEYADTLEALARRRAAELFAANGVTADNMYINVQPLSGGPANSQVYTALLQPGDTILGLNLNDGGHLSHGASVNRSGKVYNSVAYFVDEETEHLNFDAIRQIALDCKPQIIVAGFSAYPMVIDWSKFRAIADEVGAYLLADISHISGLVASGEHPSPVGIADIIMTTTHKSLCGPRGAMIMTHRRDLYRQIDRAVFPGEQGGAHFNTIGALALALKLARTDQFRDLQKRIKRNASRLAEQLQAHGLRIVGGGTENHLLLFDTKTTTIGDDYLTGDMAARLLDIAGIVTNRNTIPGDKGAFGATGIRIGTVWISQLGYGDAEIDKLAEAIATIINNAVPFHYKAMGGKIRRRAKISAEALAKARALVDELTGFAEEAVGKVVEFRGEQAIEFADAALTSNVWALRDGESQATNLIIGDSKLDATLLRHNLNTFYLQFHSGATALTATNYLRDLSDGYVLVGNDPFAKIPGPVAVTNLPTARDLAEAGGGGGLSVSKPFYVGMGRDENAGKPLPEFTWSEPESGDLRQTTLWQTHKDAGGKMIDFGGWDMPVWYTSVSEEHAAVREAAGLFDVSHMGVLEASGKYAQSFLETVTANEISKLAVGSSHYTYFLFPDGSVVDDLLIYRRSAEVYMLVVNASNNDKDWAWLNAVNNGEVMIDPKRPWVKVHNPCRLRDMRDRQWGDECLVNIALQGPQATATLEKIVDGKLPRLAWTALADSSLAGIPVVLSKTGYTGERNAYEIFAHPDKMPALWEAILTAGAELGVKPCGLASRDSTRTEAGLPLYGHELAGPMNLNPAQAGFAGYVKLWKSFFVGRDAYIDALATQDSIVTRFRMDDKAVRRPEQGDPILDKRGKVVGTVTSCAIDSEGYLLGQALLPFDMAEEGTPLAIYQLGGGSRAIQLPKVLKMGAKLPRPDTATVLSRFPKR